MNALALALFLALTLLLLQAVQKQVRYYKDRKYYGGYPIGGHKCQVDPSKIIWFYN